MDKNSILGIILIAAILIIWGIVQSPSKKELADRQRKMDSIAALRRTEMMPDTVRAPAGIAADTMAASLPKESRTLPDELGEFAVAATGENKFYSIENDLIRLVVSARGGRPYSVELKHYKTFTRDPVVLFDGDSTRFGLTFYSRNIPISTNELYFLPEGPADPKIIGDKADSLCMRLMVSEGRFIEYRYVIHPGSYMINLNLRLAGMKEIVTRDPAALDLSWEINVPQIEQLKKNENQYTSLYFRHYQDDVDYFRARTNKDVQQQDIPTQVEWVAFKDQFFSSVILAEGAFSNALLKSTTLPEENKYLKNFRAEVGLPFQRLDDETIQMKMFFGPNKFKLLRQYKEYRLEELVSLGKGIIRWINQFVIIPIFDWLSRFMSNYGIIILLLTIIIKVALLPLTYRSYLSQARMKVLKPQVDELTHKYPKGKEVERQQATMALYKKAGVSPMGGCLPMLLQFPILFAMFRFFPTSIELRQQGFLWAKDLSTYDAVITWATPIPIIGDHISLFNVLMTIATVISMKLSDTSSSTQQIPGMKGMMYIMPVMFMFMLNNFSAGLTYYYFLANLITIGQNYLFKNFVNEEEILKKIEANKAKPVRKSKFQKRLEEMAKQGGYRNAKTARKK